MSFGLPTCLVNRPHPLAFSTQMSSNSKTRSKFTQRVSSFSLVKLNSGTSSSSSFSKQSERKAFDGKSSASRVPMSSVGAVVSGEIGKVRRSVDNMVASSKEAAALARSSLDEINSSSARAGKDTAPKRKVS